MASQIQPLPEDLIYLIAAGEVIDSLEAVVRELVENALDAQATRITISVWPEQWRIQVADNGAGMDLTNLKQAATAHSTSKIRTIADLCQITSLGFRGEALHSLAQLAQLEILSRPVGEIGWRVAYNRQGEPFEPEAVAIAPGTVVTVSDLFDNWQGRRQALPSAQQLRSIHRIVGQIALCYPHVHWEVRNGSTCGLQISSGVGADSILPQILRGVRRSDLQPLKLQLTTPTPDTTSANSLQGVLGLPDRCHRHRPDWVKIALNGRMVRSPEIQQTILTAFSRTVPRDRFPVCFIHLQINPAYIDWNRHPAKEEVYLHHLDIWQQQIQTCIENALRLNPTTAVAKLDRVDKLLKVSEEQGRYQTHRSISTQKERLRGEELSLIELKAIAQVHNTYIVAEHPNGLWLVEQHIAHERVLYEQLCEAWKQVNIEPPILLQQLSTPQLEQLQRLGLQVDPFGEQLWAVRTVPEMLSQREDCREALIELSLGKDLEAALVATACRSAIRNGTPLSLPEMQTLLEQWVRTRNPRTCPHGRPIFLRLDESSLSRFFRRHWVIGKSHGI
ncbi:DNA mismatch repair endonuclease MutL [Capilliphycus salinus ALCB114379]|uniref:DNA mismatch repair endonuclease MutL n=1 Tax=Capilliphycus salinus TaxID=2768948 RepID=UPI0039A590B5